jgi:hypothetical protein
VPSGKGSDPCQSSPGQDAKPECKGGLNAWCRGKVGFSKGLHADQQAKRDSLSQQRLLWSSRLCWTLLKKVFRPFLASYMIVACRHHAMKLATLWLSCTLTMQQQLLLSRLWHESFFWLMLAGLSSRLPNLWYGLGTSQAGSATGELCMPQDYTHKYECKRAGKEAQGNRSNLGRLKQGALVPQRASKQARQYFSIRVHQYYRMQQSTNPERLST